MEDFTPGNIFVSIMDENAPAAYAWIKGGTDYPDISGVIRFFKTPFNGVLISVEIYGLPDMEASDFYGMHIHEFGDCTPPFDKTGSHYNPKNVQHPQHAGDLPPLMSNNGYSWISFFDSRFTVEEIIGKSIIIHHMRDDFTTQPSGDSGEKIACGVIHNSSR